MTAAVCRHQPTDKGNITHEARMLVYNPRYILRQELLLEAIRRASQQDFSLLRDLTLVLRSPFTEHDNYQYLA